MSERSLACHQGESGNVITTLGLTRRFGQLAALDGLSVELPASGVIGLVGPNGSGKSTLIRILLGLMSATSGSASVLGGAISEPAGFAPRVGALIEGPSFVPALSARVNLLSLAQLRGLDRRRVDEVLSVVGLSGRDREPVRRFPLGMKQRLGIAAALLPDPDLLVLDEPTNGLDPAGIIEIRALLRSLGPAGRTVVVSSHLLTEIEAVCDVVVVIRFGQLMFCGPIRALLARTRERVEVSPEHDGDADRLRQALAEAGWSLTAGDAGIQVHAPAGQAAAINRTAVAAGLTLSRLTVVRDSLEDVFLAMTGTTDGELAQVRANAPKAVA